jgi:hypothetical protein
MAIAPKTIVLVIAGLVVVGGGFAAAPLLGDAFTQSVAPPTEILGATVEFAVNDNGETYGSPINDAVPQLILALADDGDTGYVRVSELDLARNSAKSTTNPDKVFTVDVYESDGVTVVGVFTVTADTPGARDGFNN